MKNFRSFRYMLLVLSLVLAGSMAIAQNKNEEEAQRNADIEAERKAIQEEQMKIRKEMLEQQQQEMKEKQREMQEMEIQFREQAIELEKRSREATREREKARVILPESRVFRVPDGNYFLESYDQGNQSQLTLRNSFNGGSDNSDGEFDVDKDVRRFRCMISGKVKSGEITIRVVYPSGKVFKDLTINSSAEISFSQSLTIKEGEEDKYVGEWSYEVKADKAEGNYMLQIMTE